MADQTFAEECDSRSREGAWIEITAVVCSGLGRQVAPARERGLKCMVTRRARCALQVAPARERGLKFDALTSTDTNVVSLPRGSVD